jgi:hypothetical protein
MNCASLPMSLNIKDPGALREHYARIERQKGKASVDENGLPASSERRSNPSAVLSEIRQLGLGRPSEAVKTVRKYRDRR